MNKLLYRAAGAVGLLAIAWVGAGYLRTNLLALAMTLLIAAFYVMGALELRRFQQATAALCQVLQKLAEPPARLDDWLAQLPAALRHTVRLRVQGERQALPGPALTPTLAGLLVLLGMLGTFVGMVVTLNGTGLALEQAKDLQTMRDSLAAPVRGLGLAFGTSVAGVAASAMLGLMSALCRRERAAVAQALDSHVATTLRPFTRHHQREEALRLQQQQAQLVPVLTEQLQALMAQLDTQTRLAHERQLASQERFQAHADTAYRTLAASVDQTLQRSLAEGARLAADTLQPAVQATLSGITRETSALHGHIASTVQQQLDGLSTRFGAATQGVTDTWATALAQHQQHSDALAQRLATLLHGAGQQFEERSGAWAHTVGQQAQQQAAALLQAVDQAHEHQQAQAAAHEAQRQAAWAEALHTLATTLQHQWQEAGARAQGQQAQICATLEQTAQHITAQAEAHARSTIAEISRLVQAASEAPRAAADVVAQLRSALSDSLARDTAMLQERSQVMAKLNTLLETVQHSATAQKAAVDTLVASTAAWLQEAGTRFTDKIDAESTRLDAVAAQLGSSAVEVASLGEAFGAAVQVFSQFSNHITTGLQRVEAALGKATTRSDEQLAYYVAQAREVIDLSLLSQKQIVDELQRLAAGQAAAAAAA